MKATISIPKPCNEDWEKMTPSEQGRFCANCSKTVIDFTKMSGVEILNFFKNKKENICGRIKASQLKSTNTLTTKLKKFLFAFAIAFLPILPITYTSLFASDNDFLLFNDDAGGIDGKITNLDGRPIPFATIKVFQKGKLIKEKKSNVDGLYKIKSLNEGQYNLEISALGYSPLKVTGLIISSGRFFTQNIKLILTDRLRSLKLDIQDADDPLERVDPLDEHTIGNIEYRSIDHIFKGPYPWHEMLLRYNNGSLY